MSAGVVEITEMTKTPGPRGANNGFPQKRVCTNFVERGLLEVTEKPLLGPRQPLFAAPALKFERARQCLQG